MHGAGQGAGAVHGAGQGAGAWIFLYEECSAPLASPRRAWGGACTKLGVLAGTPSAWLLMTLTTRQLSWATTSLDTYNPRTKLGRMWVLDGSPVPGCLE